MTVTDAHQKDDVREYRKLIRHSRKSYGECQRCGQPLDDMWSLCTDCHEKYMAYVRSPKYVEKRRKRDNRRYDLCIAFGVCGSCGKRDAIKGQTKCIECKNRSKRRDEEIARKKGVLPRYILGKGEYCRMCTKPVEIKGKPLCNNCTEIVSRQAIKNCAEINARRKARKELNDDL